MGHATDLLSVAVVNRRSDAALSAAQFLTEAVDGAGALAIDLSRRVIATCEAGSDTLAASPSVYFRIDGKVINASRARPSTLDEDVHVLRSQLSDDPRNALGWLDLSRIYAVKGQNDKAERALRAALAVAPDNRFALRSAARFLLHAGKVGEAHVLLRRSDATKHDPWLMAAEIAVATVADRPPKTVKEARTALIAGRFAPFHLGELASALATLEANAGKTRIARKLFEQALVDPTDNTVAQAEWAARSLGLFDFDRHFLRVPRAFEANAWAASSEENWETALAHAREWLEDEPFSGRAACFASNIASVALEEFNDGVDLARQGVLTNPDDHVLRGNFVFILAEAGRLAEASQEQERLRNAGLVGAARVVWLANGGLLEYRAGRIETGRAMYELAFAVAKEMKQKMLERLARTYWAGEELRAGSSGPEDRTVEELLSDSSAKTTPELRLAVRRLERIRARMREKARA